MTFGISAATYAAVAAVATVGSLVAGEKGRSAQKKANRIQEKVRQTKDARSRIAQIREARMAQAQILQGGANQGVIGSSAVQGGYSSVGSSAENNIQFINQVDTMQQAVNRRMETASNWSGVASGLGALASITGSVAGGMQSNAASTPQATTTAPTSVMPRVGPR